MKKTKKPILSEVVETLRALDIQWHSDPDEWATALPFHDQPPDIQDKMLDDAAEFGAVNEFNKPSKH